MIAVARTLLLAFQKPYQDMFGSGVRAYSLHVLIHLTSQVKRFGLLPGASASCFENVNRFLKNTVTGTYRPGTQIAYRFLQYLTCASRAPKVPTPPILCKLHSIDDSVLYKYSACFPPLDDFTNYAIVKKLCGCFYGVKVLNNYEHE